MFSVLPAHLPKQHTYHSQISFPGRQNPPLTHSGPSMVLPLALFSLQGQQLPQSEFKVCSLFSETGLLERKHLLHVKKAWKWHEF
jgi:hypothetical protein